MNAAEAERRYLMLGQLIREAPVLPDGPMNPEQLQWLGRALALVELCGDIADMATMQVASQGLAGALHARNVQTISIVLHKTLAQLEMKVPVETQGAFIVAGKAFDALAALSKVFNAARSDILIVDPYMDEKTLTEFAPSVREGVAIRLLADQAELKPAVTKWQGQYKVQRPLEARLAPAKSLHDRLIIVDGKTAYALTQSLNSFATRAPASVLRVDAETSELKVAAYDAMWKTAAAI